MFTADDVPAQPAAAAPARFRFGLGARLAVVVLCAALPALVFLGAWVESQRHTALDEAHEWTQRMADLSAERHADFYRAVRSTLEMLAISPAVKHDDPQGCAEMLLEAQRRRDWMGNGWVVDTAGHVVCSTDGSTVAPALDAETRAQMAATGFGLSDVRTGDTEPTLLAAMDADSRNGTLHMIVESRIRAADLERVAELPEQRDAGLVIAVDRKGRALSYSGHREHVGKVVADHPVIQQLIQTTRQPVEGAPHDGIQRIFSSAVVPEWGATVIVGIGRDTVVATSQRELAEGAAIAFGILVLSGAFGWFSADWLIMRSVRVVRDAAVAMADGAMGRRAEVGGAPREIRELAFAFNRMTERLERLALHDQLTGLPNRRYLGGRLAELDKGQAPLAVMILDADNFKQINDRHGHAVGDVVLKALAERLADAVGEDGFCARVGGDEFAMVITGADAMALPLRLLAVSERVRAALGEPVDWEGHALVVTGSIGAAVRNESANDLIELFHNADRALYAAKAAGRNCMVVFDGTQPETLSEIIGHTHAPRPAAA